MQNTPPLNPLQIGRFTICDAVDAFAQENPKVRQMVGDYSLPSGAVLRPPLQELVAIIQKVEATTGIHFNHEILVAPARAAEVFGIPLGINANGSIIISEQWLEGLAERPELAEGLLLHEASHFYHHDVERTKHKLAVWNNMLMASTAANVYDVNPEGLVAAVKEVFGSVDAFVCELNTMQHELTHAVHIFPQYTELSCLPPLELLERISSDPLIHQQIESLPLGDVAEAQERIKKLTQVFLLTPGYEAYELDYMSGRGVDQEDVKSVLSMLKKAHLTGAEQPDTNAVRPEEIAAIRDALKPLRDYGHASDEFTDFMQAYSQAVEHRADIYAAFHLGSAEHYNGMLEQIHDGSGEAVPAALNNGVRLHPDMKDRMRAVSEAMSMQPSPVVQASSIQHHGATPMTRLMTLLSEQWQNTAAVSARS